MPGLSGRAHSFGCQRTRNRSERAATEGNQELSKSANLSAQPLHSPEEEAAATAAWKQEVNQRLAAHRTRKAGPADAQNARTAGNHRPVSGRAAEAAARVAARYAKAPSYSELLAGEARAVARAAGAAVEAALNAQAAAEAVLAGLESDSFGNGHWEFEEHAEAASTVQAPVQTSVQTGPPRWQDEPPVQVSQVQVPPVAVQARWQETLPVATGRDLWSEMRVHPSPEDYRGIRGEAARHPARQQQRQAGQHRDEGRYRDEGELFPEESFSASYGGYNSDGYESVIFNSREPFNSSDPVGSATVEPVEHLPANLIEFPRELVATRKARPRLAEGPFYDDSHANSQLSIFEVDPALLAPPQPIYNPAASAVAPPEWASIELQHHSRGSAEAAADHLNQAEQVYAAKLPEAHSANYSSAIEVAEPAIEEQAVKIEPVATQHPADHAEHAESGASRIHYSVPAGQEMPVVELLVARLSDRVLAAVVDGALVTLAFLAAAVLVIAATAHPPAGRVALIASGLGLLLFGLLYQFLFLSYAEEGTPGMRYARIALCTFDDENPTREQMRMRIPAAVVAAVPAGLGLLWACFDGDKLGWHDRLTRTYQRKY
jgi:uncharacterized RDD family membrane protein YckC